MKEAFLHFVWQYQYFDKSKLRTSEGEEVLIIKTGYINTDAGPDFSEAKVRIGGIDWAGQIEMHVQSSQWIEHGHQEDPAYDSVILHVVYENDAQVYRTDGTLIPVIELKDLISAKVQALYQGLLTSQHPIACNHLFEQVDAIRKFSMLDRSLMQRLERKASDVIAINQQCKGDWEETAYVLLSRSMGFKTNNDTFQQLAFRVPLLVLQKHSDSLIQTEALLFGQAGLLDGIWEDEYPKQLLKEYKFLAYKYKLHENIMSRFQWKFMRMRPANFPTIRLAQLAAVLQKNKKMFSHLIEADNLKEVTRLLQVPTSDYWHSHYDFDKQGEGNSAGMGTESTLNLIVNTIAPLLVAYGKVRGLIAFTDKAVGWLEEIKAEDNKITRMWRKLGLMLANAADSQGAIELYNQFCQQKKCLNCNVGVAILKQNIEKD